MSDDYRIALRPDDPASSPFTGAPLDDIVVKDVEMIHLEDMTGDWWHMSCYLAGHERLTFHIRRVGKRIVVEAIEWPTDVVYEGEAP